MTKPGNPDKKTSPVRQPVLLGLFTGTAVGVGFLFVTVPNVELISLIVALSGAVLGPVLGPVCGALSGTVFSLVNPMGMAAPPLLLAQALGQALMGLTGWLVGKKIRSLPPGAGIWQAGIWAAGGGLFATLFYDIFTTAAAMLVFPDMEFWVMMAQGVVFMLIHMGVNSLLFFLFFPQLVRRLGDAGKSPLVGRSAVVSCLMLGSLLALSSSAQAQDAAADSAATVAVDSLSVPAAVVEPPAGPNGWKRPLWNPFSATTLNWLHNRTAWIPMFDGGLGSMTMVLGEANTSYSPMILRDGIPQGTGHRLADDPWLVSNQGLQVVQQERGRSGAGGTDGILNLNTDEKDLAKAVSFYRGIKGPHETYMRGISLLTPRTAWRVGFEFDESKDKEGYNYTTDPDDVFRQDQEFRGHSSVRRSRTRLIRQLDEDNSLSLEYNYGRKTKDDLPVLGVENQEIWSDGAAATAKGRAGSWAYNSSFFWNNRTVEWGDRGTAAGPGANRRKVETGREGMVISLRHAPRDTQEISPVFQTDAGWREESFKAPGTGMRLILTQWDVQDGGADWDTRSRAEVSGSATAAHLSGRTGVAMGPARFNFGIEGQYHEQAGLWPGGFVTLQQSAPSPWWKLELEAGGRAPRSDELLTPLKHFVASQELYLNPNGDLQPEKTLRASLLLTSRLLGFDFALDGSARRLREGITWVADPGQSNVGTWQNDLEMNSTRLTASVARQGRMWGWGRARLEGTWQNFDEVGAQAAFLPPEQYLRMELMWEQHFFMEDGILQLALFSTHRGEMNDPWDVSRSVILPSATTHDLLLGFRLVGANLSLNFRNVTDQKVRLNANALSPGREMDFRLHWVFLY